MAKLSQDQGARLEQELIDIFQSNPSESYQSALETIYQRQPDLRDSVALSDLNYRVPKLRRSGKLPASRRFGTTRAESASNQSQHPVARAYQELDEAKRAVEESQKRYEDAQTNLRSILKQSLPQDFLQSLIQDQQHQ
ncbi:MAG: hypothetical protein H0V47_03320 [Chloroflexia bacterium]|nr:hypothetical protein [Chloroflexia bacterium]